MLPNRMQLSRTVEEQLKKLKSKTGITPNVSARIAFFRSIESSYVYKLDLDDKLDGYLILDKFTWLGRTQKVTEILLRQQYPKFDTNELAQAWAIHVEQGASSLWSHKSLKTAISSLQVN